MYDTGSSGFMLISAMLVLLMTPGLAFFYGGLSRRKNVVNTMVMSVAILGIVSVVWVIAGWSLAYGGDGQNWFIGGFDQIGCLQAVSDAVHTTLHASDTGGYPVVIDIIYQMAFAVITCAIISGAVAGRMKFGALLVFVALWVVVVYAPLAHMVWGGESSLIGGIIGALDFAGGDVVHISSGLTGLVLCVLVGARREFGVIHHRPHNVPFVLLGASLLWFGWFGFNGGSAFAANGIAALALLNTVVASGAGVMSWMFIEVLHTKKPTLVGGATGLVAGLVGITPAAGFVDPWAALVIGFVIPLLCYGAIAKLKVHFEYDDALDAFGCHTVGGIAGGILTGVFANPELVPGNASGLIFSGNFDLLSAQIVGILITLMFVGVISLVMGLILRALCKGSLRVSEHDELLGLDITQHGESAYPAFSGLD